MWLPKDICSQSPLGGKVSRVGAEVKAVGVGDAASEYCRCFKNRFRLKGNSIEGKLCTKHDVHIIRSVNVM